MPFPATLNPKFSLRWHSALPSAYFSVELTCHLGPEDDWMGPFRWCLYAHIFSSHPLYAELEVEASAGDGAVPLWSTVCQSLPFHKGCTYTALLQEASTTYWKLGSDYNHLHDDYFTKLSPEILQSHSLLTKEAQDYAELPHYTDLLNDAQCLFERLECMATSVQVPDVCSLSHLSTPTPTTEAVGLEGVGRQT